MRGINGQHTNKHGWALLVALLAGGACTTFSDSNVSQTTPEGSCGARCDEGGDGGKGGEGGKGGAGQGGSSGSASNGSSAGTTTFPGGGSAGASGAGAGAGGAGAGDAGQAGAGAGGAGAGGAGAGGEAGAGAAGAGGSGGPGGQGGEAGAAPSCGDGAKNGDEACDGPSLGGATCESLGYASGTPACGSDCKIDEGSCKGCLGTGADGEVSIANATFEWDPTRARVIALLSASKLTLGPVAGAGKPLSPDDEVMVHQSLHADPTRMGTYELARVASLSGGVLELRKALKNDFTAEGAILQVVRVPNAQKLVIATGATVRTAGFDESKGHGGIFAARVRTSAIIAGTLSADEAGYPCSGLLFNPQCGVAGSASAGTAGGGSGHLTDGGNGQGPGGQGGLAAGAADLARLTFGARGGPGHGPNSSNNCSAYQGGGIVWLVADSISVSGKVSASARKAGAENCGAADGNFKWSAGPGGSSGGSIALEARTSMALGQGLVRALGAVGTPGANGGGSNPNSALTGGDGSHGRVALRLYAGQPTGTATPEPTQLSSLPGSPCLPASP